jgi:hypothetical protein
MRTFFLELPAAFASNADLISLEEIGHCVLRVVVFRRKQVNLIRLEARKFVFELFLP